ncbi:MAG: hypothetical protein ACI8RZ_004478 [Myxococcota bacterium]|jgi:hypothetical protein
MSKTTPAVILSFLLGAVFSFGAAEATSTARQLDRLVDEVHEDIDDLRSLVNTAGSQQGRQRMFREINDLEGSVFELEAALSASYGPQQPVATSPQELARIRGAVAAESFSDDQLAVLQAASHGRRFTAAQVMTLMSQFSFSDDRIDAAVMLYPQVVDPQNWYTVYGALTFSSDKAKLRQLTR